MAWLNAVPNEKKKTRRELFDDEEIDVGRMPQCDAFFIIEYLFDVGITLGENSLTHSEIRAWVENTGINLLPWQAKFMKRLSVAYLNACHESKETELPAPFNTEYFDSANRYIKSMKVKNSIKKIVEDK